MQFDANYRYWQWRDRRSAGSALSGRRERMRSLDTAPAGAIATGAPVPGTGEGHATGMSRQDLFERLLDSLHGAALDDARWPATSALVDELCETKGNRLVLGDGASHGDIDIFFARACWRGEHRAEFEREYFEVYHPFDERLPRMRLLPDSRIVHTDELFTEEEIKTSPVRNELLPRSDCSNSLLGRLDGPRGSRIMWAVGDPVDAAGWTPARVETVGRVLPHLRHFAGVRQALAEARALGASLSGVLETTGTGVVQLDRRGRVSAANDRALAVLRRRDGLRDEDGRLRAALPEEDETLQRLVGRAVPFPGGPGAGGSMRVSRERSPSRLQVHVNPVGAGEAEARESGGIGALVLVIDPASRLRLDAGALGALLELTPAESYVAASLVEGRSAHDIAAGTGRSVTTVKWHIRHIFAKHGLSGQADLVRLAMSLADVPGVRR